MHLDGDSCYRALLARDRRFDGVFYTGVRTTGVYCRPVCPARTPGRDRCVFFATAVLAEKAGFRACFRCRPELAPGGASIDALPRLLVRAVSRIESGFLNEHGVEALATELGVTSRHLRRTMEDRLGISPLELALSRRLALAKQLLQDTSLGVARIAHASGFRSVRRFNAAFAERFGRSPTEVREKHGRADRGLRLRLDYRPPLDWARLLAFLGPRAIAGVERASEDELARVVTIEGATGVIRARRDEARHAIVVDVDERLGGVLMPLATKLRALFDLDARPDVIAIPLSQDRFLGRIVRKRPGLRLPGAIDPFEASVRAVLGQQISVRAATTIAGRLVERFGTPIESPIAGLTHRFPSAAELASARPDSIAALGLPASRARSLNELARAFASGAIDPNAEPEALERALLALPGIGPWTAQYLAMRALHAPDAFVASDLGVRKALGDLDAERATERAERWRPWRAYAVMHLWTALSEGDLS